MTTGTLKKAERQGLLRALDIEVTAMLRGMEKDRFWSRFLSGGLRREEYAYFLIQTYHYVMITPDTYKWAADAMKHNPRPHYPEFIREFNEHWREELGHEHWLQEDLKALGYDADKVLQNVGPNHAVKAYIALSRFATSGDTPLALLGQDYFLESLAQQYGERIIKGLLASSIPNIKNAVQFIMGHGEADIKHMEMNRESVSRVTDMAEMTAILRMCQSTGWLYASIPQYYEPPKE
jgi:pyrroloquinoline quinone (PQQ) biosynthesis protein C